jgi:hypothetical protein
MTRGGLATVLIEACMRCAVDLVMELLEIA